MKIDQFDSSIAVSQSNSGRSQGQKSEVSFSNFMNEALQGQKPILPDALLMPPSSSMLNISDLTALDSPLHQEGVKQGESLLACLGEYQTLLADPHKTLKEVGGSLDRLEDELKQVAPLLDKLDEKDPLSQMLQSISSLALVESIKFRRGDYS